MVMASLNVAEWSPDQVADWLSGLGPTVARYVPALRARGLDGAKLLTLRCDDLEYLGMHIIGHQELLLEAVEHLRNFQYELSRECVQQLALSVSAVAESLARALRTHDARLETQTLADVARAVRAVKPLVCWLERWAGGALAARKAALLQTALEAATCAQRDRFADQPARAVAAAARRTAATADYIIQDVSDPLILQPASLDTVTLRQRGKPLGFDVVPSFCGHHQLADIRFGSPAHASGAVHIGDEIVQVGGQCVIGWSGAAVLGACAAAGAELCLRLRRRAARAPPAPLAPPRYRAPAPPPAPAAPPDSDESDALSPPASPTHLHADQTRMYPPKPRSAVQRRHTISGTPLHARPGQGHAIDQLWHELKLQQWGRASMSPAPSEPLYPRDKAVSCSAGLALSVTARSEARSRGKLDKSHSTPAYDLELALPPPAEPIPESPTAPGDSLHKADRILDFKKSSSQIGEAMVRRADHDAERVLETVNIAMMEHRRRSAMNTQQSTPTSTPKTTPTVTPLVTPEPTSDVQPRLSRAAPPLPPAPPPPRTSPALPVLRCLPRAEPPPPSPLKPMRAIDASQISLPLRHITQHEFRMVSPERRSPPAPRPAPAAPPPPPTPDIVLGAHAQAESGALSPSSMRGIFPSSKSRSLKKKSSILAKRRQVPLAWLAARGARGGAWQRVRAVGAGGGGTARWARRTLVLAHARLYAYGARRPQRAALMVALPGCTVAPAPEVKSRPHAFKVYHTGTVFYFACDTRDAQAAWMQLIHRATLTPTPTDSAEISKQFSETDYSDTESEAEDAPSTEKDKDREPGSSSKDRERDKDRDKGKFLSLRSNRAHSPTPHASTSLDRKYLRFFSRKKDDTKTTNKSKSRSPALAGGYIHASNPNLVEFDTSDYVSKPQLQPKPSHAKQTEKLVGLVTLEQFMLKKQAEERRQVYSNRVLMGVEHQHRANQQQQQQQQQLASRLQHVVPDVIYGEVGAGDGEPSRTPTNDGYEKIVYPEDSGRPARAPPAERWRDSLRRNDKVHTSAESTASTTSTTNTPVTLAPAHGNAGYNSWYPHLRCPPTFRAETYSLARRPPRRAHEP